jgi:hypothetical protein
MTVLLSVMASTDGIVVVVVDVVATVIFSAAECTRPKQFKLVVHFLLYL